MKKDTVYVKQMSVKECYSYRSFGIVTCIFKYTLPFLWGLCI